MKANIYLSAPALVSCAGRNAGELYESCLSGYRGGFVMREYEGRNYPVGLVSGELPEVDLPNMQRGTFDAERLGAGLQCPSFYGKTRIIRIINAALDQLTAVVEKAAARYGRGRIGVCLGSCDNGSEASLLAHNYFLENGAFPENYSLDFQSASFAAEFVSRRLDLCGPVFTIATACASGASAIVRGAELIRAGICDAVVAGGADVVSQAVFAGFNALEAVSGSLTNPFSRNRNGINLGEGAAFFLLDTEEISSIKLLGAGESSDAFHMTSPGEDGAGPERAMKAALLDAGIDARQIGYVNLHGTGTILNDKAEALALKKVFNIARETSLQNAPPVSSTKPITGHTLGAAGALEAAICWMVLNEKKGLPVHCWDGVWDEEAPFLPVSSGHESPSICMTNNFAFGGCNVSLILGMD